MYHPRRSQLKQAGTQNVFPLSPLPRGTPPKPPFEKIRNVIEPLSGGQGANLLLNITVVPLVLDAQFLVQWRLLWELSLCVKVASSRSGLLATALVSKAALLRRRSRSHTAQGGALTPCGAERKAVSRTCAISNSPEMLR